MTFFGPFVRPIFGPPLLALVADFWPQKCQKCIWGSQNPKIRRTRMKKSRLVILGAPRCSKVVCFALLAHFPHFCSQNATMMTFCSKAHFLHFWPPKVAKYHYDYKPFCPVVQKVRFLLIFSFLTKICTFWSQDAENDFCAQNALWRLGVSITTPLTRRKLKVAHVIFW